MAPTVEKKIAELEMGLLHLQQNIDIPEITLPVNPTVAAVIKKCADENRKPKVLLRNIIWKAFLDRRLQNLNDTYRIPHLIL